MIHCENCAKPCGPKPTILRDAPDKDCKLYFCSEECMVLWLTQTFGSEPIKNADGNYVATWEDEDE